MKIKTLFLILIISLIAVCSFAQNESVTISLTNQPAKATCEKLFQTYNKSFDWNPPTLDGYVNITLYDVPFDTVLKRILSQINASFEFSNGIYVVRPDYSNMTNIRGISSPVMGTVPSGVPGINPSGVPGVNPSGVPGINPSGISGTSSSIGMPTMPGQSGAGVNPGMMGGFAGGRMPGQGTSKPKAFNDPIMKIRVNYNSPDQILALMDGESYADVVYRTGGGSGSSSSSSSNSDYDRSNNRTSSSSSRTSSSTSSSSTTSRTSNR